MPKIIDHNERKDAILDQAMALFKEVGLKETSLSLIAERSGINRPILYLYFSDKKQIYEYAVKRFTNNFLAKFKIYAECTDLSYANRLESIFLYLMDIVVKEDALLSTVTEFFLEFKLERNEEGFTPHLKRRTVQFRRLLHKLLLEGEKNGEFIIGSAKKTTIIFSMFHAFVLQIALFGIVAKESHIEVGMAYINSLCKNRGN